MTYGEQNPTIEIKGLEDGSAVRVDPGLAVQTFAPLEKLTPMRATEIAGRAADLVGGDRDRQHGQKHDNFSRIANMWNAWLKTRKEPAAELTAHDVGCMMVVMKLARTQSGNFNVDDYVDAAGYAACAGEVAGSVEPNKNKS